MLRLTYDDKLQTFRIKDPTKIILQGNPCVAVHFVIISNPIILYFRPFRDDRCKEMPFLPRPELIDNSEHYKSFDDSYGKETKDVRF